MFPRMLTRVSATVDGLHADLAIVVDGASGDLVACTHTQWAGQAGRGHSNQGKAASLPDNASTRFTEA